MVITHRLIEVATAAGIGIYNITPQINDFLGNNGDATGAGVGFFPPYHHRTGN